jgi:hypothetical protein
MPLDAERLGRAILDAQRREAGMPTRRENIEAMARADLERRKALADAGISETDLATKQGLLSNQPAEFEQGAAESGALVSQREASTAASTAAADLSRRKLTDPLEVSGGASLMTPEGQIVGTAPKQFDPRGGGQTYKIDTVDEHGNAVQRIVRGEPGMEWPKGPTAEARNMEIQGAAVDPAFETMLGALDALEQTMGGDQPGIMDRAAGVLPGTDTYWAKDNFIKSARALAGAIVARQAGEGSRLSDEDRRAYSEAAAVVNNLILLPGGITEARRRLTEIRKLLANIQARRKAVASNVVGMSDFATDENAVETPETQDAPGAVETKTIRGVTYHKVPGGWRRAR